MDDTLRKLVDEARRAKAEADAERAVEAMIKVATTAIDKGAAQTNVFMVAGYAGLFGVWSIMKPLMTPIEMRTTAACLTFSLAVFVCWEVIKMLISAVIQREMATISELKGQEFYDGLKKLQRLNDRQVLESSYAWPVVFVLTLAPGLVAAGVLLAAFLGPVFRS